MPVMRQGALTRATGTANARARQWGGPMRLLLMLGLGGFISALSMRATDPMLPILAEDLRVSIGQAALLASAYATPYSLM